MLLLETSSSPRTLKRRCCPPDDATKSRIRRRRRRRRNDEFSTLSILFLCTLVSTIFVPTATSSRFILPSLPSSSSSSSPRTTTKNAARRMFRFEDKQPTKRRNEQKRSNENGIGGDDVDADDLLSLRLPSLSVPALNVRSSDQQDFLKSCQEVSTKFKKRVLDWAVSVSPLSDAGNGGFYYGVKPTTVERYYNNDDGETRKKKPKPPGIKDSMNQALDELRLMRIEMEALRKELHDMKRKVTGEEEEEEEVIEDPAVMIAKRREKKKRLREFEKIASEVKEWADDILFRQGQEEGEQGNGGWTRFQCNNMFEKTFNKNGQTSGYLKWMKDSRGKHANENDERLYPCLKLISTLDAPLEEVCLYLSQSKNMVEYNDLIVQHKDLEIVSPHSKICWGLSPQLLFIKPREMITFCHHQWLRDGTQVVVNQAVDYNDENDDDSKKKKSGSKNPKAYAIRGANYISRHPDDPEKTRLCIIVHANPGDDVPHWATRTAINSLVPIEPFKLFHRINQGVLKHREELQKRCQSMRLRMDETEMVSSSSSLTASSPGGGTASTGIGSGGGVLRRPAGLAQLGYACFWPEGGGIQEEGTMMNQQQQQQVDHAGVADALSSPSAENLAGAPTDAIARTEQATEEGDKTQDIAVNDEVAKPSELVPSS